jgi:PAS domain S-box-containing protein
MTSKSPLRIWVPGCATGEEAYSIAMLILEHCATTRQTPNLQIFASDIDEQSLEVARRGIYTASSVADVSPSRLQRFFVKQDDNHYQVNSQLRGPVVVTRQNVISDPPFSRLDLISCRNVLIYFEPELQQKIISLFHFGLNERGYLFLGTSETVGQQTNQFETVSSKWRIFQRLGPARPERQTAPVFPFGDRRARPPETPAAPRLGYSDLMQKLLLTRYAPAAVLIDRGYEVLSFFGAMSDYLEFPSGQPTMNLLAMSRRGLRTKIRFACQKVLSGEHDTIETDAQLQRQGTPATCVITANRLHEPREAEGLLLVVFREKADEAEAPAVRMRAPEDESAVVRQLEYEVESTREDLQGTIEELQSSNEEVMSMNEELQSANEELESSKEELQSFNEELSTVNAQLQGKVEELERTNDDIRNLFNSTEIATIFLDTELRIRRFTPRMAELLNIIDADIGRPVSDLAPKYADDNLLQDARRVLDTLARTETEVRSDSGRWYLRRILPYRTEDNRIDGVTVTFVDITERIDSELQSRRLAAVLEDSNDSVMVLDLEGRITAWNHGAERMYGYTEAEALHRNIREFVPEDGRPAQEQLVARIARGEQVESFEVRRVTRDGRTLDVWLTITRLTDERGRPIAVATTERDITDRKRKESELQGLSAELENRIEQRTSELKATNAELRRREHEFRALADNVPALFSYIDVNQRYRYVNKQYELLFQRAAADIAGKTVAELVGETNYRAIEPYIAAALGGQRVEYETELEFPAGHRAHRARLVPEQDEQGQVVGFFTLVDDITDRRRTESALGEQQRRLQAIVNTAADAIITIDQQGCIDTFNHAAEMMFGYTAQEAVGQNVKMLMPTPYRDEHDGYLAHYLKTGEARIIGIGREIVAQRRDGTVFPIDLAVSKLHDGTQELFTGIVRDLSERKAMQKELLTILADEQRRIGQDLHDVVGQELTGLSLLAASLAETLREHSPSDTELAGRIGAGIGRALEQIRQLSKGLVPVEVDAEGLRAALTELAERLSRNSKVRCEFQCDQPVPIENNETATHLFRIAQEAVTNALKHGSPRNIRIALKGEKGRIVLEIRDDGTGLPPGAWQAGGMGLKTMQYRAALIGATLSIAPLKRKGTLVTCHLMELRSHG